MAPNYVAVACAALLCVLPLADALCKDGACKPEPGTGLLGSGNPMSTTSAGPSSVFELEIGNKDSGYEGMLIVRGENFVQDERTTYRCCFSSDSDCYHKPAAYVMSNTELHCSLPRLADKGMRGFTVMVEEEGLTGEVRVLDAKHGVEWNGHRGEVVTLSELRKDVHHGSGLSHEENVAIGIAVTFSLTCVIFVILVLRMYRNKKTSAAMRKFFYNFEDEENEMNDQELGNMAANKAVVQANAAYEG